MNKLNVKGLALALGVLCGGGCLLFAWASGLFNWGADYVELMGTVYVGYAPTFVGGLVGLVWGFLEGMIGGALLAWLYNKFSK